MQVFVNVLLPYCYLHTSPTTTTRPTKTHWFNAAWPNMPLDEDNSMFYSDGDIDVFTSFLRKQNESNLSSADSSPNQ